MINLDHLKIAMEESHIQPEYICQLLNQGIEVERLRLQIHQVTETESIESHVRILQGERFMSLLAFTCTD